MINFIWADPVVYLLLIKSLMFTPATLSLSSTIPLISRTNTLARFRAILSATFNPFGKQKFSLSGHLANKSSFADGIGAVK